LLAGFYRKLARRIWAHRRAVVVAWALLLALAATAAWKAPVLLEAASGSLENTPSADVEGILARDFDDPFTHSLAVVFHSDTQRISGPAFQAALQDLARGLRDCPGVARVIVPGPDFGRRFRAADGHGLAVLVGLDAKSIPDSERMIPPLRAVVRASAAAALPGWTWAVTGQTAVIYDLNQFNARDSRRAELRALPLTALVLLVVFGSWVAASLPLVLGFSSTVLALGLVPALSQLAPVHILYQNMASLLGLALGIDYALFLVSRYREGRALGQDPSAALEETLASTGVAVTYSGCTVLIGLMGLLFAPLFELRSMALGGLVVVVGSLVLALTLLPALLGLLDPWLRPAGQRRTRRRWARWTSTVLRRPLTFLSAGLALLLALSWPLLQLRPGFPDRPWFPQAMEATRGLALLGAMGQAQEITPVDLVVSAEPGRPLLPAHLDDFFRLSSALKANPWVARVSGPVDLREDLQEFQYRLLYMNWDRALREHPELDGLVLSRRRDQALVQVVLKDSVGYEQGKAFVRSLSGLDAGPLTLKVGGHWAFTNDYDAVLLAAYPRAIAAVFLATLLVLLAAFRSYLVPLKALLLNSLSVSAAFGATVWVFQLGHGCRWLGLDGPLGAIPLNIPLLIFCITFGLSMDYEVLILARVREERLRSRRDHEALLRGMAATGALVSGAAAIMAAVFGAFALADVVLVKMLGFGLVVAVLADALVVRAMLVPAFMRLAGAWNWVPGIPAKED
jgi:RND superfamily putative drug exporter